MDKPLFDSDADPKRIKKVADGLRRQGEFESARMLDSYADLLEAREKAVPVAWRTFDGEGNYDYRDYENNEHYRDRYVSRNGAKYANWVEPLYSHPAPSDAEMLAEALRNLVSEWVAIADDGDATLEDSTIGYRACANRLSAMLAAHSAQTQPPAQSKYAPPYPDQAQDPFWKVPGMVDTRPKAQPPAASVTVDAVMKVIDGQRRLPYCSIDEKQAFRNELEAALAAQENPNG